MALSSSYCLLPNRNSHFCATPYTAQVHWTKKKRRLILDVRNVASMCRPVEHRTWSHYKNSHELFLCANLDTWCPKIAESIEKLSTISNGCMLGQICGCAENRIRFTLCAIQSNKMNKMAKFKCLNGLKWLRRKQMFSQPFLYLNKKPWCGQC